MIQVYDLTFPEMRRYNNDFLWIERTNYRIFLKPKLKVVFLRSVVA